MSGTTGPRVLRRTVVLAGLAAAVVAVGLVACTPPEPPTTTLFAWEDEDPSPVPRFEANGAAAGGKLYVFGGYTSHFLSATTRSDVFDPATGEWSRLADLPTALTHAATVVDGRTIWLLGGAVGGFGATIVAEVWRYDIDGDTWTAGPSLPAPRMGGGGALVGGELHYFGGASAGDGDSGSHWAYDLSDPQGWEVRASMPVPRNHIGAATVGGAIYAIGGRSGGDDDDGNRPEVHRYDPGTGLWTRVANLPAGRGHLAAGTFVSDGRIVVAGGTVNGQRHVRSIVAYDPIADVWAKLPALPAARSSVVADIIDGRVVVTTGNTPDAPSTATWSARLGGRWEVAEQMPAALGEVAAGVIGRRLYVVGEGNAATYAYDLATGTWITRAARPFPGHHHAAEVIGRKLYLFGGLGSAKGKVQIYDPAANTWRLGAPMPFAAGSSSSALIGGRVYVAGGIVNGATTTRAAVYNPTANTWSPIAPMPQGRNHAASGTGGGRLFVFGGRGPGSGDNNSVANGFDTVQAYDPVTDTWRSSATAGSGLAPLPQARGGMGKAAFVDGRFYVMGGETLDGAGATSRHVYRRVDVYDPDADHWSQATPMPTARHGIFPVVVVGRVYVAGGGVESGFSSSRVLEVYNALGGP